MSNRLRQLQYALARLSNQVAKLRSRRGARAASIVIPVVVFVTAVAAGAVSESSPDPDRLHYRPVLSARVHHGAASPRAPSTDPAPSDAPTVDDGLELADGPVAASRQHADWIVETLPYVAPTVPEPRWIRHDVAPGERLDDITARYGVDRDEVIKWNRLNRRHPRLLAGQKLKIKAQRFPAPRLHGTYRVRKGDTWSTVASSFGLSQAELRRANRRRKMVVGTRLHVWSESGIKQWGAPVEAAPALDFDVPPGAVGVGLPYRGRLDNGIQLPDSELYTRRIPRHAWGTSHTVYLLQHGIASFRHSTGFDGEVLIGGISRQRGGKFKPHRSHRTGRDVDINLLAFPGFEEGTRARGGQVDWGATWALMRTFIDSGQVRYIFLSYRLQKKLYNAAKLMGASEEELAETIQWPRGPRSRHGIVRHSKGHVGHFHVRFRCGPNEQRCLDP